MIAVRESRRTDFMAAALKQTPVRSTLAIQLYTGGQELGTLQLFSDTAGGIDDETEEQAFNLAPHAATALSSARRGE